MGGERDPGVLSGEEPSPGDRRPAILGQALPGPIGLDGGGGVAVRKVKQVVRDWDASAPKDTQDIPVSGTTLADAGNALDAMDEWGRGGGSLRTDPVPVGTSPDVTVTLHANLVLRMPNWSGYDKASAAAKAEWDRMSAKLKVHEQRHVDIAVEEAEKLATALLDKVIDLIPSMVTNANAVMAKRQKKLDTDTDHGAKAGVPYGDVTLDTTIT